jgi:hypothetical protein
MASEIRARSALAMRIARVDRITFNQAVSDGHYRCAPRVQAGSTRVFSEDDLIALFWFGRLLDIGLPPRIAGHLACKVHVELRINSADQPKGLQEPRISIPFGTNGMHDAMRGYDPDHVAHGTWYGGMDPLWGSIECNVAQIRSLVRQKLEDEMSILGKDDGAE